MQNTRVLLASRPAGRPTRDNWTVETVEIESPGEGEFLAEVRFISVDPAMRGWINEGKSYIEPVEIGAVMRAGGVARVVESLQYEAAIVQCFHRSLPLNPPARGRRRRYTSSAPGRADDSPAPSRSR